MKNYIQLVKKETNEKSPVIVIDNSDITKPYSKKMEALSDVRDGSTGEIKKGICLLKHLFYQKEIKYHCLFMKKFFLQQKKAF